MSIVIGDLDGGIGVHILACGTVTGQEYVKAHLRHLYQQGEKLHKVRYTISDWSGVTQHSISSDDVKTVARFCWDASEKNQDTIVAIVVNSDRNHDLARMFRGLAEGTGWDIMVFRSIDDAKNWVREKVDERFGIRDLTLKPY